MKTITSFAFIITVGMGILFPMDIFAQKLTEYEMLAPLPGVTQAGSDTKATAVTYIQGGVKLLISLAAAFAVLRIILGGIQYMSSDAFGKKSEAKNTIQNAIWGLILAISSFVILNTVNPDLVNFNLTIPGLKGGAPIGTDLGNTHGGPPPSAESVGCNDCVLISQFSIPAKEPGQGGCSIAGTSCYIHRDLGIKLNNMAKDLANQKITWQVTEMYPPTVRHESSCHMPNQSNSGKCVDASISQSKHGAGGGACIAGDVLTKFLTAIETHVGNNYQYEVPKGQGCFNTYQRSTAIPSKFKQKIRENAGANAQHAHINL